MIEEKRSDLINRPDKWTANTEIDFGGGLYGQRFTGTITANANAHNTVDLSCSAIVKIVGYGGSWYAGGSNIYYPVGSGWLNSSKTFDADSRLFKITNAVRFQSFSDVARSNAAYDIWVLYTKS